MSENRSSKSEELLENSKILCHWPMKDGQWALSIKDASHIDKILWEFHVKGDNQQTVSIYMDGIRFYRLYTVLKGNLHRCPGTWGFPENPWLYQTGMNGSKKLSIEKGQKTFLAVRGYDAETKKGAVVGLSEDEVFDMLSFYEFYVLPEFFELWGNAWERGKLNRYHGRVPEDQISEYVAE